VFAPFQLPFVQRGLVEVLILSVGAGVLGTWIVLRGLAFFSHAVGTATFPGLVLADGIGFSASLGAFGVALAFTASLWGLARRRGTAYDSLTALVLVGCLAAGRQPEQCPPEESAAATQLTLLMVEARNKQGERISCRD